MARTPARAFGHRFLPIFFFAFFAGRDDRVPAARGALSGRGTVVSGCGGADDGRAPWNTNAPRSEPSLAAPIAGDSDDRR